MSDNTPQNTGNSFWDDCITVIVTDSDQHHAIRMNHAPYWLIAGQLYRVHARGMGNGELTLKSVSTDTELADIARWEAEEIETIRKRYDEMRESVQQSIAKAVELKIDNNPGGAS